MFRPSFALTALKPGSEVAGETAAAMAAGALVFREAGDNEYADLLESNAKALYEFAYNFRGIYSEAWRDEAGDFYGSSSYTDELCHGALWLYRLTDDDQYMDMAMEFYNGDLTWALGWDDKTPATQLMMYIVTQDDEHMETFQTYVDNWKPGGGIP